MANVSAGSRAETLAEDPVHNVPSPGYVISGNPQARYGGPSAVPGKAGSHKDGKFHFLMVRNMVVSQTMIDQADASIRATWPAYTKYIHPDQFLAAVTIAGRRTSVFGEPGFGERGRNIADKPASATVTGMET